MRGPLDSRGKGIAELRMSRARGCIGQNVAHCGCKLLGFIEQVRNS
ncbi:hypothetical protein MesoLj131a_53000 [Mesorhizobium sp. 131-2-1]|nr:hypothetical protein MesoLj131a_53000 [Mesorhizobium sp. 131-2-1]